MYDVIIRGGQVVDGTGEAPFGADVGIRDGVIVEIGKITESGRQIMDADGAVVTPGWVDAHTHYDGQVTWDDVLEGSAANGVTTTVMGNCGVGFAPCAPDATAALIDLMEGVEDIPGTALWEGMPWGEWETFPEYLDFLDQRQWTMDVAAQLPHGAVRFYVMGERAIGEEDATEEDLGRMATLVEEAVRSGAVGFSSSRIQAHRSMSGVPVPGTFAPEKELRVIAAAMAAGGGATFQVIPSGAFGVVPGNEPDPVALLDDIRMFGRISKDAAIRMNVSFFQASSTPEIWSEALQLISSENGSGAGLYPMVAPRAISSLTSLDGYHPFTLRPTYRRLADLPHDQRVAELGRPEIKAAILSESDVTHEQPGSMDSFMPPFFASYLSKIFPLTEPLDYEPTADRSMSARAQQAGRDPLEYLYDFLLEQNGTAVGVFFTANYAEGNLDVCREMLLFPESVWGLSDGGAHARLACDMATATFMLTHWARDRSRGEQLPLELLVSKATSLPARLYGIRDRGTLAPGMRADVNVIDFENLKLNPPKMFHDLPAGGARYLQGSTGYLATLVRGIQTRDHDRATQERPGRLLRNANTRAKA